MKLNELRKLIPDRFISGSSVMETPGYYLDGRFHSMGDADDYLISLGFSADEARQYLESLPS